jgi:adenylate cyclase
MSQPRYRLVEIGGMGEVWLADDLMLERQVAVKFLTSSTDGNASDQLLAEARSAAALVHPYICSIYEVTSLDQRPCIVMEYVRGETLERRLRGGPMTPADGLRLAEEIAEALDAAHKRRIVHRDLKPANVMVTEDDHVKVMDFGLATQIAAPGAVEVETVTVPGAGLIPGTPAYMSPEQIRGEAPDRRTDIFAFGILVYELLTGVNPFARTGLGATVAAILSEPVAGLDDQRPGIPRALAAAVARMLAKDSADRFQSFSEVRTELRRAALESTTAASQSALSLIERASNEPVRTLVGRTTERAQIAASVTQAASGAGGVLVLSGERGVGKTRLAEHALEVARRCGCLTLVGRCYEEPGSPALIPYIELLEDASRLMPAAAFRQVIGPSAPELAKLLPELHQLCPDMPAPMELPPELRQRFLFTTVRDFLLRCSRVRPLAILIDDIQWADDSTIQLTAQLAPHVSKAPLLLIATFRDAELSSEAPKSALQQFVGRVRGNVRDPASPRTVKAAFHQLASQGHARLISLRPFTDADVQALLATFAPETPPPGVVKQFLEQTGGNPFFIVELCRHLSDEGRLLTAHGRWRRDVQFEDIDIPESVRVVVERRLQRASSTTQDVLRAAAVLSRPFDLDLLQAVAGVDDDALISALDEAEASRLLQGPTGRQDSTWRFPHQLICQTLTQATPTLRRQRLHLRAADAMEHAGPASRYHAADLARHLYCAGRLADAARTSRALVAAADAAYTVYATEEAIHHYRCALEVLDGGSNDTLRRHVEERVADLLALIGDRDAATERYHALAAAYEALGTAIDHARILRKLGTLRWQSGDRAEAMRLYERAQRALEASAAPLETAHLYQELGLAAFRSGDNQRAIEWAERAVQAAESALANDSGATADLRRAATAAIAHATNTIGVALARSGQLDAARERIERSVGAARDLGLLDVACRAYANLGVLYSSVEPQRAIDVSLTGLQLASKIGAPSLQSYLYANLAAAYCALTDRCETEGLQAAQAAADLDREIGQLDHLAVPLIVLAQIYQCRGELHQAQQHYEEALGLAERANEPQLIVPCYDGLATICLDRGDRGRAEQYMERSRQLCERTGVDPDALLLLPFLS